MAILFFETLTRRSSDWDRSSVHAPELRLQALDSGARRLDVQATAMQRSSAAPQHTYTAMKTTGRGGAAHKLAPVASEESWEEF